MGEVQRRGKREMTPTIREILIAVGCCAITAIGTLQVARYEMKGELASSDVAQSQLFLARIENLETRLDAQAVMLAELGIENAMLKSENRSLMVKVSLLESQGELGPESRAQAVFDLFADWQTPAWCKRVVTNEDDSKAFVVVYSNSWFEYTYNISQDVFVGSTDFDIFQADQAAEYYKSDLDTYKLKGWQDFLAPRPMPDGTVGPLVRFKKLHHQVTAGPELICGWEVE